jgi:PAS domain S-box-containing protein
MDALTHIAFDAAPIGLVLTENRVIRRANATFASMAGYDVDALIGQSFRMFYDTDTEFAEVRDIGLAALEREGAYCDERMLRRADGTRIWCRFRARSLTPKAPLMRMVLSFAAVAGAAQGPALTPREREVLQHMARGLTSKEIAQILGRSPRTVEDVRARLLRKFGVPNAARLLARLGQSG